MNELDTLLFLALEASGVTPEEFGERLAMATAPVNLDSVRARVVRASARSWFLGLPNGYKLLVLSERAERPAGS